MDLARSYGRGPQSLSDVARHEALPVSYLEQLVGKLRRAGLVTSRQGARGGYELTRGPEQISVGEVMRVLEGPISPMVCATEGETAMLCVRQDFCAASIVWERVRDSVAQALDSLTLADLVPPRHSAARSGAPDELMVLQPMDKPIQAVGRKTSSV